MLSFDDQRAEVFARWDLDFQIVGTILELFGRHLFVGFDPGLRFGLASLGAHPDPFQFASQVLFASLLLAFFQSHSFGAVFQPRAVVAFERDAAAAIDFEDPLGHVVQEVTIVGDGHNGALVVGQVLFQPRNGFGIEVVGRFVEQQQVGLANEQLAKCDAAFFATRQVGDLSIFGWQVHDRHRHFDEAIEFPKVVGVDDVLQRRHLVAEFLHFVVVGDFTEQTADLVVAVHDGLAFRDGFLNVFKNGLGRIEWWLLFEVADREAFAQSGGAFELGVHARHDFQQGGFAGTVGAEHTDLCTGVKGEVDVLKDLALTVFFGQVDDLVDELTGHVFAWRAEGGGGEYGCSCLNCKVNEMRVDAVAGITPIRSSLAVCC